MDRVQKQTVIEQYQIHAKDVGSIEVQIAVLTAQINHLNGHLATFKKDFSARRGLMKMVGRRRSFLSYIKNKNINKYQELISKLGLRG